jgi:transcriptional regulator with XRE-family HTH domain
MDLTPQAAIHALSALGWSQDKIARAIDVTQMTISNINRGKQAMYDNGQALVALARKEMAKARRRKAHGT